MEVRKIVRLFIIIFALLCVVFGFLYKMELDRINTLDEEFVRNAVENLTSKGIEINESVIVDNIPDKDIYVFSATDVEKQNGAIIDAFVKQIYDNKNVKYKTLQSPEGITYDLYDGSSEINSVGRAVFSDKSDGTFTYFKTGFSESVVKDFSENAKTVNDSELLSFVDGFYSLSAKPEKLSYRICGFVEKDGLKTVTAVQTISDYDIYTCNINFTFKDSELVCSYGKLVQENPKAQYHNRLMDGVNVLYKMDLSQVKAIKSERLVYLLRKSENDYYYLVPGWEITYIDSFGKQKKQYIDAL